MTIKRKINQSLIDISYGGRFLKIPVSGFGYKKDDRKLINISKLAYVEHLECPSISEINQVNLYLSDYHNHTLSTTEDVFSQLELNLFRCSIRDCGDDVLRNGQFIGLNWHVSEEKDDRIRHLIINMDNVVTYFVSEKNDMCILNLASTARGWPELRFPYKGIGHRIEHALMGWYRI